MPSLARICLRHRKLVLLAWILALLLIGGIGQVAGTAYSNNFSLPHTESVEALDLLESHFPVQSGSTDQIVIQVQHGTVNDPPIKAAFTAMLDKVEAVPHVAAITSPYATLGATQISADKTIAFATVTFDEQTQNVPKSSADKVVSIAKAAANDNMKVALGGQDIENTQSSSTGPSTGIGIIFALIVLGLVFGALFAAFLPVITALFAIGIGYTVTGLLSHAMGIADFAPIIGLLIGLGVGVDYALFIVTRHRMALKAGATVEEALVQSVNTAGRAVFFAGLTVCIALLGQFVLGVSFLYGLAICASITVLLTMVAALTLLPALLGFFGMRVLSRRERRRLAANGPEEEHLSGFWIRWAQWIERRPALPGIAALLIVAVVAMPVFTLRLGLADAGADPSGSTTLQAYQLLAKGFGPGFNGPFQLVSRVDGPAQQQAFATVVHDISNTPGIKAVTPPRYNADGTVGVANAYPTTSPQAPQTTVLVHHLRRVVIPEAAGNSGVHVLVGGTTAGEIDFSHILSSKLVLFLAVIIILSFILLMAVFRSLLIPFVASIMNILSVGAALGVMNAVFEWGWGHSLLRLSTLAPVEVFLPVIMIAILFGLSMDYEVFLVSRMREEWVRKHDATEAVTHGQAATGRVITAAALIMILVFASFAIGDNLIVKQFGIGLGAAILIDAFVVRTALVPAIMHISGRASWWLPGWLDRILPHLNIEGTSEADESAQPALAGGGPYSGGGPYAGDR